MKNKVKFSVLNYCPPPRMTLFDTTFLSKNLLLLPFDKFPKCPISYS